MSVEHRINVPSRDAFAATVEAVKGDIGLDQSIAADIYARLSLREQARTSVAELTERVRQRIDPSLVDILYEPVRSK